MLALIADTKPLLSLPALPAHPQVVRQPVEDEAFNRDGVALQAGQEAQQGSVVGRGHHDHAQAPSARLADQAQHRLEHKAVRLFAVDLGLHARVHQLGVGLRAERPDQVDAVIEQALAINDAPVVVEFVVHKDAMVWPMVAAGTSNDEIKVARDMAPNWDEEEL